MPTSKPIAASSSSGPDRASSSSTATAAGASQRSCRRRSSTPTPRPRLVRSPMRLGERPCGAATWTRDWTDAERTATARDGPLARRARRAVRGLAVPRAGRRRCPTAPPVGRQLDARPRPRRLAAVDRAGRSPSAPTAAPTASMASCRPRSASAAVAHGPVALVVGDVSFLHDLNALRRGEAPRPVRDDRPRRTTTAAASSRSCPRRSRATPAGSGLPEHYEELFGTPHGVDVGPIVDGPRRRARHGDGQRRPGAGCRRTPSARPGVRVLELRTDRDRNVELHREVAAVVARALATAVPDDRPGERRSAGRSGSTDRDARCCCSTASPGRGAAWDELLDGLGAGASAHRLGPAGARWHACRIGRATHPSSTPRTTWRRSWTPHGAAPADVLGYSLGARVALRLAVVAPVRRRAPRPREPDRRHRRRRRPGRAARRRRGAGATGSSATGSTPSSTSGSTTRSSPPTPRCPPTDATGSAPMRRSQRSGRARREPAGRRPGRDGAAVRPPRARDRADAGASRARSTTPAVRVPPGSRPGSPGRGSSSSTAPATRRTTSSPTPSATLVLDFLEEDPAA